MTGKWFVLNNPMAGYIVARLRNTAEIMNSGNLEYYGKYSDDKAELQETADKLNSEISTGGEKHEVRKMHT